MAVRPFAHLHCHTHYSLLDGANRVPELVEQTKSLGMTAAAITDHGNLFGAIEFYTECRKANINPIIGYEAYLAPGSRLDKTSSKRGDAYSHLTLLAKNETGFKNLIKLSSIAFTEGFYHAPRIDREALEAHHEGLICLSGCLAGEFNDWILKGEANKAETLAVWFSKLFKKDFYIELQNNGLELQDQCTVEAVRIADKLGLPLVATADAHYLCEKDAAAHDVLVCINTGKKRGDPNRMRYGDGCRFPNPYYVRSPDDMYRLFPGKEEAVKQSQLIADSVDIQLDFKKRHFPVFTPPKKKKPEEYLRELCLEGMKQRYGDTPPEEALTRLEHELAVICKMGFAGYFLIVWDFVRFAIENGIPCSARGSGCGAIVSYVLRLSHVDPLRYDLLFERFLDPNRGEAPDIDIDFCQDRREMVIEYVKKTYGEQSVAQIATFGTMAAKAAIKDVGRVLDIPLERVNFLTKWVSGKPGATIQETIDNSPEFRREYESDPVTREWIDIALKLEGTNRNAGTHAAGVVIANGNITDYVPVQIVKRKDDSGEKREALTTQWVMGDLETVGMLKMDFLGLRTLTLVDNATRLIKKTRGLDIDVYTLPLDDAPTYKLLQRGDAKGVFQFESEGIRELLKRMKPDNIRDIIACTALYRPGPLEGGMVDEYIDCKHGRKQPTYEHPVMEEVLAETHGVMVYQEQVMRILNRLGDIELSSAYACIKAISKKKHDIIDARKVDFVNGARKFGMAGVKAEEIFNLIVKFGGYGFNKSHSAAYALVSYQTAYLKQHFPAEFMAALLSSEIDDGNKRDMLVDHIGDARKFGAQVLPPDVNRGEADFTVVGGQIVFGLTAIKGLGRGAAENIVAARLEKGEFTDLYDFCERVDGKIVGKSAIEKLIMAGAFDKFATPFAHRAQLLAALPGAIQNAEATQKDRQAGQMTFFDLLDAAPGNGEAGDDHRQAVMPNVPRWSNTEQLKAEKEALDFYFSSHPLAEFEQELKRFVTHDIGQLRDLEDGQEVRIGGMMTQVRFMNTKKGDRFVRCKIEDFTGQADCVMWPSDYQRYKDDFREDRVSIYEAGVEWGEREDPIIVLRRLMDIEQARKELTKGLILKLAIGRHSADTVEGVQRVLKRTPGPCQVYMVIRDAIGRSAQFRLGDDLRVHPAQVRVDELEMLLGAGSVVFTGR